MYGNHCLRYLPHYISDTTSDQATKLSVLNSEMIKNSKFYKDCMSSLVLFSPRNFSVFQS